MKCERYVENYEDEKKTFASMRCEYIIIDTWSVHEKWQISGPVGHRLMHTKTANGKTKSAIDRTDVRGCETVKRADQSETRWWFSCASTLFLTFNAHTIFQLLFPLIPAHTSVRTVPFCFVCARAIWIVTCNAISTYVRTYHSHSTP